MVHDADAIAKLKASVESCQYCLTVCTGSALLAKTGLINQCQATSNKQAWDWVTNIEPAVNWERHARWCVDGKYYTSSGVSAGMDMVLALWQNISVSKMHRILPHWLSISGIRIKTTTHLLRIVVLI